MGSLASGPVVGTSYGVPPGVASYVPGLGVAGGGVSGGTVILLLYPITIAKFLHGYLQKLHENSNFAPQLLQKLSAGCTCAHAPGRG
jgi:hypothetical protein